MNYKALEALLADQRLPPVAAWQPESVGEIDIHIDRQGVWRHAGSRFRRPALVKLLASVLRRDGDDYFLVTPQEKLRIRVDDAPFVIVDWQMRGQGPDRALLLRTNVDEVLPLDDAHPLRIEKADDGPRPYVQVRDRLDALVVRSVFYQLVELAEEADGQIWLAANGCRLALGPSE